MTSEKRYRMAKLEAIQLVAELKRELHKTNAKGANDDDARRMERMANEIQDLVCAITNG